MPGPLVVFGNPGASESAAWQEVIELAKQAQNTTHPAHRQMYLTQLVAIAERMRRQVRKGVHANPQRGLAKDTVMSKHVQAIAYVHAKDDGQYVHGFGNCDPSETDLADGWLNLNALKLHTNVEMIGHPDGSITLRGTRGQPLAALFE